MSTTTTHPVRIEKLAWTATVDQVLAAWPKDRWLAAMISSGKQMEGGRDRWSIIAQPIAAVPVGGASKGAGAPRLSPNLGPSPASIEVPELGGSPDDRPPFVGGWIASLRYELGGVIEPAAASDREVGGAGWRACWFCCPTALVHDHKTGTWWHVQAPADVQLLEGQSSAPAAWPTYDAPPTSSADAPAAPSEPAFNIGPFTSGTGQKRYTRGVKIALGHIADGDIYQVNLTHQLHAPFKGSSRALMRQLLDKAQPWYGAYLEYPIRSGKREAIVSSSPEMFLSVSRDGRVSTRPMKGTRANTAVAAELRGNEKEQAELTMIVDLMRSDLGRVCTPGSITVDSPRDIETHAGGTLLQATATVSGQLREGASITDLLAATFPGGSVTGAPKIRAMQIINRLEREPRGQYCGAVGFVSLDGTSAFNIAIRTASVVGPVDYGVVDGFRNGSALNYGVGAGIVADSDPDAEWQETLDKAKVLLDLAGVAEVAEPVIDEDDEL
jgi:anthranilate/para-aminobenzoate synthase component I